MVAVVPGALTLFNLVKPLQFLNEKRAALPLGLCIAVGVGMAMLADRRMRLSKPEGPNETDAKQSTATDTRSRDEPVPRSETRKPSQSVEILLGILLFSGWMLAKWYVERGGAAGPLGKATGAIVGGLVIAIWWVLSIPLARLVERGKREGLRALFWLPWMGLSIALCVAYYAFFMPPVPRRGGAVVGVAFAFLLTAPVVFASSWSITRKVLGNSPENTPRPDASAAPGVPPRL